MNRAALMPSNAEASMPSVYRLWRSCQDNNALWWSGGIAAQPRVLMMEFEACRRAAASFDTYAKDIYRLVKESEDHLQRVTGGIQH